MAAVMLTYLFMGGIYNGVCLYIDVFRGPTYVPMYTYTHIGPDNKN